LKAIKYGRAQVKRHIKFMLQNLGLFLAASELLFELPEPRLFQDEAA
jgi:hypothetical protein